MVFAYNSEEVEFHIATFWDRSATRLNVLRKNDSISVLLCRRQRGELMIGLPEGAKLRSRVSRAPMTAMRRISPIRSSIGDGAILAGTGRQIRSTAITGLRCFSPSQLRALDGAVGPLAFMSVVRGCMLYLSATGRFRSSGRFPSVPTGGDEPQFPPGAAPLRMRLSLFQKFVRVDLLGPGSAVDDGLAVLERTVALRPGQPNNKQGDFR